VKDLPVNYLCVESGKHGHLVKALRIYKAFTKLLKYDAAVASAFPTVPTISQEIIIAFARYTFMLDVQALLDPQLKNDMDKLLDFQKILNCSPSARALDDAVDELATDQAMLASFEIERAGSVFLQSTRHLMARRLCF
jgi:hypothetical protein